MILPDFSFDEAYLTDDLERIIKILINDKKPLTVVQRKDTIDLLEEYEYNRNSCLAVRKRDDALTDNDFEVLKKTLETKDEIILSQAREITHLRAATTLNSRFNTSVSDGIWRDFAEEINNIKRSRNAT